MIALTDCFSLLIIITEIKLLEFDEMQYQD